MMNQPTIYFILILEFRVPTAQGKHRKQGNGKTNSGKIQGIRKFYENIGKTQGIGFARVVNSLILKVKDISVFSVKIPIFLEAG